MTHETTTSLTPEAVLERAKSFFAERTPHTAAFVEKEGPRFVTFRGQGGEEIAMATVDCADGTCVRASTMLFDQAIGRFFSTLPTVEVGR